MVVSGPISRLRGRVAMGKLRTERLCADSVTRSLESKGESKIRKEDQL